MDVSLSEMGTGGHGGYRGFLQFQMEAQPEVVIAWLVGPFDDCSLSIIYVSPLNQGLVSFSSPGSSGFLALLLHFRAESRQRAE